MCKILHTISLLFFCFYGIAQFPPPVGHEGTTAIHKDSSIIINWVVNCTVERGFKDISNEGLGFVNAGEETFATGAADGQIISLGDGGEANLIFNPPIKDGQGFDFAVFENGFTDDFLELAFVEVSSDGEHYFRFDAVSLTQTSQQTGSFDPLNATKINNLAGKYRIDYGVPFDIEELDDNIFLNKDSICYLRIIDVVGSIQDEYASNDSQNNKINDPWPTPFDSGGFDLDAVGVINNTATADVDVLQAIQFGVHPNPVKDKLCISFSQNISLDRIVIFNEFGVPLSITSGSKCRVNNRSCIIDVSSLINGLYFIRMGSADNLFTQKFLKF